jgi:hypothetical protein
MMKHYYQPTSSPTPIDTAAPVDGRTLAGREALADAVEARLAGTDAHAHVRTGGCYACQRTHTTARVWKLCGWCEGQLVAGARVTAHAAEKGDRVGDNTATEPVWPPAGMRGALCEAFLANDALPPCPHPPQARALLHKLCRDCGGAWTPTYLPSAFMAQLAASRVGRRKEEWERVEGEDDPIDAAIDAVRCLHARIARCPRAPSIVPHG